MAVVIANYIRPGSAARAKAKATILYNAERAGREKEELFRVLFGWQGPMERGDAELLIDRAPKGTIFFRVMINFDPVKEDADKMLNIWEIVRKTYEELERALGLAGKIQFIAALHDDHTNLRHIHSLMLLPHRLTKEQFQAIAYVPRLTATGQAQSQRQVLDRTLGLRTRREPAPASRQSVYRPAGSVGGKARRVRTTDILAAPPPTCPADATGMKRTKQGYRCPTCGYRQEQELSFEM